ncbi:hypothetical protein V6N12_047223 [Hibiscus sabdariffa]|uniref:Uncharacterized protein n=1 Tax=Hibiscus sabdariffa TaxID=183260 RepID=A0ABR2DA90_9ROSI
MSLNGEEDWFCSFIYGSLYDDEKKEFWDALSSTRSSSQGNWCIVGDTNMVAKAEDKIGGVPFNLSQAKCYFELLDRSYMLEILIKGGTFTWLNQRSVDDAILEKLERILFSLEWSNMFPKAVGILDTALAPDHAPILLLTQGLYKKGKKDFKFESKWLLEEECFREVENRWETDLHDHQARSFGRKLKRTRTKLIKWNKGLKDENGEGLKNDMDIASHLQEYFQNVYSKDYSLNYDSLAEVIPEIITPSLNLDLSKGIAFFINERDRRMSKYWTPSENGIIKLNCDVAFDKVLRLASAAVIARDSFGSFIK